MNNLLIKFTKEWDRQSDYGWDNRTPEDMAYAVTSWFAQGGSHHNYYMWFGNLLYVVVSYFHSHK